MSGPGLGGRLLVATPALRDPNFHRAVVLVLEHNEQGALGLAINRPSEAGVAEALPQWEALVAEPRRLFVGGPVQPTAAICVGVTRPGADHPGGFAPLHGPLGSVDLSADPDLLAASLTAVRVFVGYAGWGEGQLEAEIEMGSWYVTDSSPADPLFPEPGRLWSHVLRRQGGTLAMVATCPDDPTLN
jgi:putative transcriptional regulator